MRTRRYRDENAALQRQREPLETPADSIIGFSLKDGTDSKINEISVPIR